MTRPPALVRPRTDDDLPACVRALAEVHAADRYPVDWPGDPAGWLTPDDLAQAWVAVDDDGRTVLGHVGLTRPDPHVTRLVGVSVSAVVSRLFVVPRARGRSVAAGLLAAARAAHPSDGPPLTLEVSSEGRAAIAFYERNGWRRVSSSRGDWLNAAGEPALLHHYVSP
ncbi:GNAT family N-acetyltransferase [Nonomuraea sp. SMC257]|uniref:GNAT family N-acetyltransferase n=1 Tax=Nonomuraea montanisoli TaxID=2741721 RepID=A0A7Y6M8E8_9ACTN|nr:GNAT family N-acetyltransferase [Nonomuraea montanisoli]NUW37685.1 GNAT family N-acetyltransferase [Nonomuraea montanisoli]